MRTVCRSRRCSASRFLGATFWTTPAVARDEPRLAVVGLALVMFLDEGVAVGPVDVVVKKSATARKRRKK
jgi:hypothetical protein